MGSTSSYDRFVNTSDSWITQNFILGGVFTILRLQNGRLTLSVEGTPLITISPPSGVTRITKASIDNNRICIIATPDNEKKPALYWCCINEDTAIWVEYIFAVARTIASSKSISSATATASHDTAPLLDFLLDHSAQLRSILITGLEKMKPSLDLGISVADIADTVEKSFNEIDRLPSSDPQRRTLLGALLNTIFSGFMRGTEKNVNDMDIEGVKYEQFDAWAQAYEEWVKEAHGPLEWNRIRRKKILVSNPAEFNTSPRTARKKPLSPFSFSLDTARIHEIAIGNWHQTVATHYLLLELTEIEYRRLFGVKPGTERCVLAYIDQEPIMTAWQLVPGSRSIPYPLSSKSLITASNSVISCLESTAKGNVLYWMRFDYHNYRNFKWFPLNWTEWYFNSPFDVDTLRLSFKPSESKLLRAKVLGLLGDLSRALVDPSFRNGALQKILGRYAERKDHHPGWHKLAMPAGSTTDFSLRTSADTAWPVPGVNIFMNYLLILSRALKTAPKEAAKPMGWVDTVLDLLDLLYVSAKKITDGHNAHSAIRQGLGFLGENPLAPSYNYPVWLICRMQDTTLQALFAPWSTVAVKERFKLFSSTKPFVLSVDGCPVVRRPLSTFCPSCWAGAFPKGDLPIKAVPAKDASAGHFTQSSVTTAQLCISTGSETEPFTVHYLRQQVIVLQAQTGKFIVVDNNNTLQAIGSTFNEATVFSLLPTEVKLKSYKGPYVHQHSFLFFGWLAATAKKSSAATSFILSEPIPDHYRLTPKMRSALTGIDLSASLTSTPFSLHSFGNHMYSFKASTGQCLQLRAPFGIVGLGETDLSVKTLFKMVVVKAELRVSDNSIVCLQGNGELVVRSKGDNVPVVVEFGGVERPPNPPKGGFSIMVPPTGEPKGGGARC